MRAGLAVAALGLCSVGAALRSPAEDALHQLPPDVINFAKGLKTATGAEKDILKATGPLAFSSDTVAARLPAAKQSAAWGTDKVKGLSVSSVMHEDFSVSRFLAAGSDGLSEGHALAGVGMTGRDKKHGRDEGSFAVAAARVSPESSDVVLAVPTKDSESHALDGGFDWGSLHARAVTGHSSPQEVERYFDGMMARGRRAMDGKKEQEAEAAQGERRQKTSKASKQKALEEQRQARQEREEEDEEQGRAEAAKWVEEQRRAQEEARKLEEQRRLQRAKEEFEKLEEQRHAQEEARRLEEQRRAQRELKELEEQRRAQQAGGLEGQRRAQQAREEREELEEQRRAAELEKQRREQRAMEEMEGLAREEARRLEEQKRRARQAGELEEQGRAEKKAELAPAEEKAQQDEDLWYQVQLMMLKFPQKSAALFASFRSWCAEKAHALQPAEEAERLKLLEGRWKIAADLQSPETAGKIMVIRDGRIPEPLGADQGDAVFRAYGESRFAGIFSMRSPTNDAAIDVYRPFKITGSTMAWDDGNVWERAEEPAPAQKPAPAQLSIAEIFSNLGKIAEQLKSNDARRSRGM